MPEKNRFAAVLVPQGGSFSSDVTHALRADGFDASEDGTGRGTPLVPTFAIQERAVSENPDNGPQGKGWQKNKAFTLEARHHAQAVAFAENQRGELRESDISLQLTTGGGKAGQGFPSARVGMAVRRLTPTECERLQGFTTCIDRVIIHSCSDPQKSDAHVALKCLRLQSSASHVGGAGSSEYVSSADCRLQSDPESRASLVHVHVRSSHAMRLHAILSRGKFLWCASGAAGRRWFLPSMQPDDIALGIAAAGRELAVLTANGKAGSRPQPKHFTVPAYGSLHVGTCGQGSAVAANGANENRNGGMRSITSSPTPSIPPFGSTVETWLSFVLSVTSSFIPTEIPPASSYSVCLDIESDWTAIPYRSKPAADGPRYRAIGNSMAVPVLKWIGERIEAVEAAMKAKAGAA